MWKPRLDPSRYPEKTGVEGWLLNEQCLLVEFNPDASTAHAQWVLIKTYSFQAPLPPVPQAMRRMLRHNAIEAWLTMQKTGWRRCQLPVRW